jgi:hypothetical protein
VKGAFSKSPEQHRVFHLLKADIAIAQAVTDPRHCGVVTGVFVVGQACEDARDRVG